MADEPCSEGSTEVWARRCNGQGQWGEPGWISVTELTGMIALSDIVPCGGNEKKVNMVLELATKGWKPAEIERVLKAL